MLEGSFATRWGHFGDHLGSKTGPGWEQMVFTKVVLHKLKWGPPFEKSVERTFDV